ncbi:MAG TPA: rhodanese-like domain-containing protein [Gammaproteobacteria bacterium]|jgi:rhodanese-related sulfurtransferase|nr:rhodanese-like domain-containing protein [Gammaproteobacteria bacterium]
MAKTAEDLVREAKTVITEIGIADAKALLGGETIFVDVREPPEWKDGTIPEALCIPRGVLEWRSASDEPLKDKARPLVVYCKTGGRSALAAQTLEGLGFDDVKSLAGGFDAWSGKTS